MTTRHINCKTPTAILFCAVPDEKGVLRVAGGDANAPGLTIAVKALLPIVPQLLDAAAAELKIDAAKCVEIVQDFADETQGGTATLYVASVSAGAGVVASPSWPSLPQILRSLKGRDRIPYLRAWQVLAGGLHLETKAIDTAELAKHFDD
jgi:hypothetical protein